MRRLIAALAVIAAGGSVTLIPAHAVTTSSAIVAKKVCHTVTKKVHGKRKRIRVCKNVEAPTPTPSPTVTPTPTATVVPDLPTAANPDSITSHPDAGRAVSQLITASAGGSLSASGADGSTYVLSIPANALLGDTTITMTPLAGVDGLPFSRGLVAGVLLQPQGLQLYQLATLTVTLKQPVAAANQIGFESHDDGSEFHLYPRSVSSSTTTLSLQHFTTAGIGSGTLADVTSQLQHPPTSATAQMEQLAGATTVARDLQQAGQPVPVSLDELLAAAEAKTFNAVVGLLTHALGGNDAEDADQPVSDAQAAALGWIRQATILGVNGTEPYKSEIAQLSSLISQIAAHEYQNETGECGTGSRTLTYDANLGWLIDAEQAAEIIPFVRQAQLIGDTQHADLDAALKNCRPRGFKFEGLKVDQVQSVPSDPTWYSHYIFSAHVCGTDPEAQDWTVQVEGHADWPGPGGFHYDGIDTYGGWRPGTTMDVPVRFKFSGAFYIYLVAGPTPQVMFENIAPHGAFITTTTSPVPLEEDTTCPPVQSRG